MLDELISQLNLKFKNISHLKAAFHLSDDQHFAFERLEFLGDRVLGLVLAKALLDRFPTEKEGDISKRHAALVFQDALVQIAENLNLPAIMNMNEAAEGRRYKSFLSDRIEALVAALYLDSGLEAARDFILTHWAGALDDLQNHAPPRDPKTSLQEWCQKNGHPLPQYDLLASKGPAHSPFFTVQVTVKNHPPTIGEGASKKEAEQAAAEELIGKYLT